ncbi:hypothetical protein STEG23_008093 [Scotinomys teguina]
MKGPTEMPHCGVDSKILQLLIQYSTRSVNKKECPVVCISLEESTASKDSSGQRECQRPLMGTVDCLEDSRPALLKPSVSLLLKAIAEPKQDYLLTILKLSPLTQELTVQDTEPPPKNRRCLLDHPANYVTCRTGQVAPRRGARGTDTDRTARKLELQDISG